MRLAIICADWSYCPAKAAFHACSSASATEVTLSEGKVVYTIVAGPRIRIRSVKFKGNKSLKSRDLHEAIKTSTREWVLWPAYYTEEKIAADVEKLRTLYYQRGFLNHRIGVEGQAHITFIIEEGPLYHIRNIILKGNTHYDDETLLAGLELEPGQTYYRQKAVAHAKDILKRYRISFYYCLVE